MKKLLLLLFSLFFLYSPSVFADELKNCNLNTHVKFTNEKWKNFSQRKFRLIIEDNWVQVFDLSADSKWGNFYITTNTKKYINAIFEENDPNDSWIKILAYNKVSGYTKLISTSHYGETIHLGLCL